MPTSWEHNEGRPATMNDVQAILAKIRPASENNPPVNGLNLYNMVKATKGGYPAHLFHESLDPVICLRPDQEDELSKLGYVRNYIPRNYPRTLFRRNTDPHFDAKFDEASKQQITEHAVETRIARDEAHERAIRKERKPATAGEWAYRVDDLEPLPDDNAQEDAALVVARLEGQLAEARAQAAERETKKR